MVPQKYILVQPLTPTIPPIVIATAKSYDQNNCTQHDHTCTNIDTILNENSFGSSLSVPQQHSKSMPNTSLWLATVASTVCCIAVTTLLTGFYDDTFGSSVQAARCDSNMEMENSSIILKQKMNKNRTARKKQNSILQKRVRLNYPSYIHRLMTHVVVFPIVSSILIFFLSKICKFVFS